MRLVKKVCKKCMIDYGVSWSNMDEYRWVVGDFLCPHPASSSNGTSWSVEKTDKFPGDCIHKFEHAVAAGMSHVK
jgi:hypothetical protein